MAIKGRKRKPGNRYRSGDLKVPRIDRGTPELRLQRALGTGRMTPEVSELWFKGLVDDAAQLVANDCGQGVDAIGRAWVAGLLEYPGKSADAMRDAGRVFFNLYWSHYAELNPSGGMFKERIGRGSVASLRVEFSDYADDPVEAALNRRMHALGAVSRECRNAVEALCLGLDHDAGPAWLDRLIALKGAGAGYAEAEDWALMQLALRGLAVLA